MQATALTAPEQRKLNDLETIIEKGLQTFVEVGAALSIIREQRLYRETHGTFEDYCQERWGWNASRSRQLIGAAEVVGQMEGVTTVTPENERQARELARVPEEQRAEVWEEAVKTAPVKNGKPRVTAKAVREIARAASPRSNGVKGPVVDGLEEKARALIAAGAFVEQANEQGLGRTTFKKARDIILLAEDDALLPADRAVAQAALETMRETGQVSAWESVRELVAKRFGKNNAGFTDIGDAAAARLAAFERAANAVVTACEAGRAVSVPYLPAEVAQAWEERLTSAATALRTLQQEVRRYIP